MTNKAGAQFEIQSEILNYAEAERLDLSTALEQSGITLDDLVYANSSSKRWKGSRALKLDDLRQAGNNIPFVSFFSGCGGMDLGFETAGFQHVAAFEVNELFCKTLRRNRPRWHVVGPPANPGDVSNVEQTTECLQIYINRPFEGVFIGGPPCQPFSIAANQRFTKSSEDYKRIGFEHEEKGSLLVDYVNLIEHFTPACFLIENVPGLRDLDGGKQLDNLLRRLARQGYSIKGPEVINAAQFGVPQSRERLFIVGNRAGGEFVFPPEADKAVGCGSVLCASKIQAPNHETRMHKLSSVRRYRTLDYGERDQLGRVDRLNPCEPSKTVIAGGDNGGGRSHLHPEIPRTLTVRECARLQTFPDDYVFVGTMGRQFTQVGNAVPPVLAAQIATSVANAVFGVQHPTTRTLPATTAHIGGTQAKMQP